MMIFGKYNKDYELRETISQNGRTVSEAVYVGSYYRFKSDPQELSQVKKLAFCMTAVSILSCLVPLFAVGDILLKWYVMVPMIFTIVPISQLVLWTARVFTAKEKVTRRGKDQLSERLAPWSAVLMILASLSLAGQIFYDIFIGIETINIVIHLCTIFMIAAGAVLFSMRNRYEMTEAEDN
jgi:hypothetical protein